MFCNYLYVLAIIIVNKDMKAGIWVIENVQPGFFFKEQNCLKLGVGLTQIMSRVFVKYFMKFSVYEILIMWRKYKIRLTRFYLSYHKTVKFLKFN